VWIPSRNVMSKMIAITWRVHMLISMTRSADQKTLKRSECVKTKSKFVLPYEERNSMQPFGRHIEWRCHQCKFHKISVHHFSESLSLIWTDDFLHNSSASDNLKRERGCFLVLWKLENQRTIASSGNWIYCLDQEGERPKWSIV
jgi:hypothetical protein